MVEYKIREFGEWTPAGADEVKFAPVDLRNNSGPIVCLVKIGTEDKTGWSLVHAVRFPNGMIYDNCVSKNGLDPWQKWPPPQPKRVAFLIDYTDEVKVRIVKDCTEIEQLG